MGFAADRADLSAVAARQRAAKAGRLVGRSCERSERLAKADVAQLAERVLGKDEVTSSILVIGSILRSAREWSAELRMASQPRDAAARGRLSAVAAQRRRWKQGGLLGWRLT